MSPSDCAIERAVAHSGGVWGQKLKLVIRVAVWSGGNRLRPKDASLAQSCCMLLAVCSCCNDCTFASIWQLFGRLSWSSDLSVYGHTK